MRPVAENEALFSLRMSSNCVVANRVLSIPRLQSFHLHCERNGLDGRVLFMLCGCVLIGEPRCLSENVCFYCVVVEA